LKILEAGKSSLKIGRGVGWWKKIVESRLQRRMRRAGEARRGRCECVREEHRSF